MPSEQTAGRPVYSSDLYSLGLTAIYLLTGKQPQTLEVNSQTGEIMWRQEVGNISPILASVLDSAIAYHPRDRYSTARAMLDALQSISNPIPPTQPYYPPPQVVSTASQPTVPPRVVSTPPTPTVPVAPKASVSDNNQKGILFGSLIAGGLIGASVIVGLVLTKSSQPVADSNITHPATSPPVTPIVSETPIVSPPPPIQINKSVAPVIPPLNKTSSFPSPTPTPIDVNTTDPKDTQLTSIPTLINTPTPVTCTIEVADPQDPTLNVRSGPGVNYGVISELTNGTHLSIVGQQQGWYLIDAPIKGWLAANRTRKLCGH